MIWSTSSGEFITASALVRCISVIIVYIGGLPPFNFLDPRGLSATLGTDRAAAPSCRTPERRMLPLAMQVEYPDLAS
jgi:hypothetical protein